MENETLRNLIEEQQRGYENEPRNLKKHFNNKRKRSGNGGQTCRRAKSVRRQLVMKIIKELWKWLKCELAWYLSPKVLEAINNGATYEEVLKIVNSEAGL